MHLNAGRARVLEGVGQRLLHDPVHGHIDSLRQPRGLAVDDFFDRQPGVAGLFDERIEAIQARRDAAFRPVVRLFAQDAEHPIHVGQRAPAADLDRRERLLGDLGLR